MVTRVRILEQYHVCTVKYNGGLKNSKIFAKRHVRSAMFSRVGIYPFNLNFEISEKFKLSSAILTFAREAWYWCMVQAIFHNFRQVLRSLFIERLCSFFVLQLSKCKKVKVSKCNSSFIYYTGTCKIIIFTAAVMNVPGKILKCDMGSHHALNEKQSDCKSKVKTIIVLCAKWHL